MLTLLLDCRYPFTTEPWPLYWERWTKYQEDLWERRN